MDAGNIIICGSSRHVNDKIANLAIKVALIDVPLGAVAAINVDVG